jgi:hypothetical protein
VDGDGYLDAGERFRGEVAHYPNNTANVHGSDLLSPGFGVVVLA